jgi:hypothetical protein
MPSLIDENLTPLVGSDEEWKVRNTSLENTEVAPREAPRQEDSAAKAKRLAEQLRFRLMESMAQRGGSEAFLHWLRSDGEKHA